MLSVGPLRLRRVRQMRCARRRARWSGTQPASDTFMPAIFSFLNPLLFLSLLLLLQLRVGLVLLLLLLFLLRTVRLLLL